MGEDWKGPYGGERRRKKNTGRRKIRGCFFKGRIQ